MVRSCVGQVRSYLVVKMTNLYPFVHQNAIMRVKPFHTILSLSIRSLNFIHVVIWILVGHYFISSSIPRICYEVVIDYNQKVLWNYYLTIQLEKYIYILPL